MPRAGTGFVMTLFYQIFNQHDLYQRMQRGLVHQPPQGLFFRLSEPACFNFGFPGHELGLRMLDLIQSCQEEYLLEDAGQPLVIIKHHDLRKAPTAFLETFDKVIVCVRKPESWLLSASAHPHGSEQMETYAKRTGEAPENYGTHLYDTSLDTLSRVKGSVHLDFHETEENIKKLKETIQHVSEEEVERIFRKHWRGSEFEESPYQTAYLMKKREDGALSEAEFLAVMESFRSSRQGSQFGQ